MLLAEVGALGDALEAFFQSNRTDLELVRGDRERLDYLVEPDVERTLLDLLRKLVEMAFDREARLHRTVAALGAAWRLVGEHTQAFKLVTWNLVSNGSEAHPCSRGSPHRSCHRHPRRETNGSAWP